MAFYPKKFRFLISKLKKLPQIGEKTAERLANFIFKMDPSELEEFIAALKGVGELKECPRCFNLSDGGECLICRDKKRRQDIIAVVETPLHIQPLERAGFRGVYFVLGGLVASYLADEEELHTKELLQRIKKEKPKEVILAFDSSLEGEATAMYVNKEIKNLSPNIKISRLAAGLPIGADLEYTDETTLREALKGRKAIDKSDD
ncbi:recombination protein RecR [bacterium]|nr:recombination protein RecR [bacterium]